MSGILVRLQTSWSIGKGLRSSVLGAETASDSYGSSLAAAADMGYLPTTCTPSAGLARSDHVECSEDILSLRSHQLRNYYCYNIHSIMSIYFYNNRTQGPS
jgi:hypothetical protein